MGDYRNKRDVWDKRRKRNKKSFHQGDNRNVCGASSCREQKALIEKSDWENGGKNSKADEPTKVTSAAKPGGSFEKQQLLFLGQGWKFEKNKFLWIMLDNKACQEQERVERRLRLVTRRHLIFWSPDLFAAGTHFLPRKRGKINEQFVCSRTAPIRQNLANL